MFQRPSNVIIKKLRQAAVSAPETGPGLVGLTQIHSTLSGFRCVNTTAKILMPVGTKPTSTKRRNKLYDPH
jgi:hypothetical protein